MMCPAVVDSTKKKYYKKKDLTENLNKKYWDRI